MILVIQGVDQGARFEVAKTAAHIGRGVPNEIHIHDTEVSRRHATINWSGEGFTITDHNSSNGTYVNGAPVRDKALNSGDQIQLGRSTLLFTRVGDGEATRAADQINLVGQHSGDDRSSIVGEVSQDAGRSLLADAAHDAVADDVGRTLVNLRTLYRITEEVVSPSFSPDQLLNRILDLTIEVVAADRGCILVSDAHTGKPIPRVFQHRGGVDATQRMTVSRSIVDYVLQNGQGVRTSDARSDRRFEPGQSILQAGIREAMCVPMQGRFGTLGAIYVDTTTPPEQVVMAGGTKNQFNEDQLRLLVAIGRQAALAVENNRYQQAFVHAERLAAIGQTIATLSHHIKNILQGVRGGSYLIDMGLNDHDEQLVRKGWGIVEKNQNKIYHLVMDMLTFSKERTPAFEHASLNDTVSDVFELMQSRAEENNVEFQIKLDPKIPESTFDAEGIHRAVLNIVTNAIDAVEASEEGAVLISTGYDEKEDSVHVSVVDNGPGIPDEQLQTIFNVFESTKGGRGTGLGLAVSQKIIREHGGEISVTSEPNEGSRFLLAWPRIDEEHRHADGQTQV